MNADNQMLASTRFARTLVPVVTMLSVVSSVTNRFAPARMDMKGTLMLPVYRLNVGLMMTAWTPMPVGMRSVDLCAVLEMHLVEEKLSVLVQNTRLSAPVHQVLKEIQKLHVLQWIVDLTLTVREIRRASMDSVLIPVP